LLTTTSTSPQRHIASGRYSTLTLSAHGHGHKTVRTAVVMA
jgi:hypothetical protein